MPGQRFFVIAKKKTGGKTQIEKIITHAQSKEQARRFAKFRLPKGFIIERVQKD